MVGNNRNDVAPPVTSEGLRRDNRDFCGEAGFAGDETSSPCCPASLPANVLEGNCLGLQVYRAGNFGFTFALGEGRKAIHLSLQGFLGLPDPLLPGPGEFLLQVLVAVVVVGPVWVAFFLQLGQGQEAGLLRQPELPLEHHDLHAERAYRSDLGLDQVDKPQLPAFQPSCCGEVVDEGHQLTPELVHVGVGTVGVSSWEATRKLLVDAETLHC